MPFPQTEKEVSIRRILLRFNDTPTRLKVRIDESELVIVENEMRTTMIIPIYMLTNSEVFRLVYSYITNKLAEHKVLN